MSNKVAISALNDKLTKLLQNKLSTGDSETIQSVKDELISIIEQDYISRTHLSKITDDFNEALLKYAQHNYSQQVDLIDEDDDLSSVAISINLLGEELNHSTITKHYLSDIFSSMPDMLIVVDELGYIDSINNKTACGLGYSEKKLVRRNIQQILEEGKTWRAFLREVKRKGSATFITRKGDELPVSISVAPFVRGDNKEIGTVIIAKDLSAMLQYQKEIEESNKRITQANEELLMAIQRIEESDKLKTAFLQNISHEIRTPLNSIIGLTHIINQDDVSESERKEFSSVIEKSGNRLIEIVNNILEISKIETGQYEVTHDFFNLNELLGDLSRLFANDIIEKKLKLSFECELEDAEALIYSDEYVINQVLVNLIKNAIKFTNRGSVKFGYKIKEDYLEFFVKDTGVGISHDNREKIFDRFTQIDTSLSRSHEGAGLGLSISKGIIELLGGRIWVRSIPDMGSTFFFTVPYHPHTMPDTSSPEEEVSIEDIGKLKILIVEDDDLNYLYFYRLLQPRGHIVHRASNGMEAIDKCKLNRDLDVVLMDIKMPVLDGIEATKRIKAKYPDLPVIAITAFAFGKDKEQIMEAGFNDYLTKPMKLNDIYLSIARNLMKG